MKIRVFLLLAVLGLGACQTAPAGKLSPVSWESEGVTFQGEYAPGKKGMPGIIIFHQWLGLTDHERDVALRLNQMGYTVLAADVYGKDLRPQDRDQARALTAQFYQDRMKLRNHANANLRKMQVLSGIPAEQLFAIGYCFGGTTVLELGRSGAGIKGLVSLHGGLSTPSPEDNANIRGKVLILHGALDQAVPMSDVQSLEASLQSNRIDWSVHVFSDAVHGFTHRHDPERYNEKADKRSWQIMLGFFQE